MSETRVSCCLRSPSSASTRDRKTNSKVLHHGQDAPLRIQPDFAGNVGSAQLTCDSTCMTSKIASTASSCRCGLNKANRMAMSGDSTPGGPGRQARQTPSKPSPLQGLPSTKQPHWTQTFDQHSPRSLLTFKVVTGIVRLHTLRSWLTRMPRRS
jgi:hypothetical protein